MKVNDILHGFRVLKQWEIPEADSVGYEFIHEKTGAKLFYLANDDDNKVFYIAFKTPPADDRGTAHIIEHSVLCGSRKYPLKEPFVELVKGSLNTFLNAITYPDKTVYPVASRNEKDFKNLMDVYLDAVFYPNIYSTPEILMQEGWHYELDSEDSPLTISGVVYNEMKGALSSPDDYLGSRIMANLYPDNAYGFESGGDPEAIPSLTQEMFLDFHKRYYHPSNSYIYLYGDLDIEERLQYLDKEYLSRFDKISVDSKIEMQPFFHRLKRVEEYYPCGMDEDTKEKTFLSLNMMMEEAKDPETMLALSIMDYVLLKTPASPLRKAIIDAKLGKDVDSSLETDMLQPYFSIVVNGTEKDKAEDFLHIIIDTLKSLKEDGLDKELLESAVNIFEFRLREADFGHTPKGLVYGIGALRSWLYGGEPTESLYYEEILSHIKEGFAKGYFEKLLDLFVENPHQVMLVMEPSPTMGTKRDEKEAARLSAVKSKFSAEEIKGIMEKARMLKERQSAPETEEALRSIPLLKISDIRKTAEKLPTTPRISSNVPVLYTDIETHGIAYLNLYFDALAFPQDKLHYLYLMEDLLSSIGTKSHTYEDLAKLKDLVSGGVSYDLVVISEKDKPDSFRPIFKITSKALVKKLPELMDFIRETLTETVFTDKKRLKELLMETQISIEMGMQRNAHQIVSGRVAGCFTLAGRYREEGDLSYLDFIKNSVANFDEFYATLNEEIPMLMKQVFNSKNLTLGLTLKNKHYSVFESGLPTFIKSLPDAEVKAAHYSWDLSPKREGLLSSSRVQYVGVGANFQKLGFPYRGTLKILETILHYDYFWTKIRVQGGAYGAFTTFTRNGDMFFGSYRDPGLTSTIEVFENTADYIRDFTVTKREMDKYIIGTMGNSDMPLTPQMKGSAGEDCHLRRITYEDRQKSRDEILSAGQEDIRALAPLVDACLKERCLAVFGGEEKLKEEKNLFDNLIKVTNSAEVI